MQNVSAIKDLGNRRQHIIELALLIVYKALYEFFYLNTFVNVYPQNVNVVGLKTAVGWFVYIIICVISIYLIMDAYYSLAYRFLIIIAIMPAISLFQLNDIPGSSFLKVIVYWCVLLFAFMFFSKLPQKVVKYETKQSSLHVHELSFGLFELVLMFSIIIVIVMITLFTGLRFSLNLGDLYEFRMVMRLQRVPTILNYAFTICGGALLPACFAFFLARKQNKRTILSLLFGLMAFSVNGMKTWLLLYLMIIAVYIITKKGTKKLISYVLIGLCVWITFSHISYWVGGSVQEMALLSRTIHTPAKIGYNYVEFFDNNEHLFLRESILRIFFDSPYPMGSDFYIVDGANATITTARANNGIWGDAYKNFAFAGLIVYPFMLAFIVNKIKVVTQRFGNFFSVSILLMLLWSVVNTSFFTWLLTGGVIPLLLITKYASGSRWKVYSIRGVCANEVQDPQR